MKSLRMKKNYLILLNFLKLQNFLEVSITLSKNNMGEECYLLTHIMIILIY